jgi:hypothetical protein
MTVQPWFRQRDAGRRLGYIGRGGHRDSHLCLAERRCAVGSVTSPTDSMATLLERLDEVVLSFRKNAREDCKILGTNIGGNWRGWTDRSIETCSVSNDGNLCGRIPGDQDRSHSQRVQLCNQSGGIRPGRIS